MKRIDVLKDTEQTLVNKAYEKGHISHRKDGDWQKTNDGWKRISGYNKDSHQWQSDKRQKPLTADQIQELQQISDIDERKKRQTEMLSQSAPAEEYGEITEEDLVETSATKDMSKHDVNDAIDKVFTTYDEDAERLFGTRRSNELKGGLVGEPKISYGSDGKIVPADRKGFDKIVHFYMDKAGVEDTPENYKHAYRFIKGMAINNHLLNNVNKSYRDMRSAPVTKNMGF